MERSLLSVNNASDSLIRIGKIVAPHGVRGDLRILPEIERPDVLKSLKTLYFGKTAVSVLSARPHKNVYIVHVKGVDDRNRAEEIVGTPVFAERAALPKLPKGEYYYFQLLTLTVVEENGHVVGPVKEIIQTGANDVYGIQTEDGKELCIPAIPSCILAIDLPKGTMTVKLPEWE